MLLNKRYCIIQIPNLHEINNLSWKKLIIFAADDHQIKSIIFLYDYIKTRFLLWEHLQRCSECDLVRIFFISKFSNLLIFQPRHKTKTGTANRWQTTNSKSPGQINKIGQNREGAAIRSYLLHSSLAGVRL
jgi:hypothetical protein